MKLVILKSSHIKLNIFNLRDIILLYKAFFLETVILIETGFYFFLFQLCVSVDFSCLLTLWFFFNLHF